MGFALEWLGFVFLWFGFRRHNPLAWMAGALVLFPLAQALVHWVASEMNPSVDFKGWGGFQAVFVLRFVASCWLCMAAYAVFFIWRKIRGLGADAIGP